MEQPSLSKQANSPIEHATLGAGCFWCVEAVYTRVQGVLQVNSGYIGGQVENPTYQAVCSGETGHAEVVQLAYDPRAITYAAILDIFWQLHDPTTLNRQGADRGTQYRSAIFYHSEEQKQIATESKLKAAPSFESPIVTEITPASTFYQAESNHQDYYNLNRGASYCQYVIHPKLIKLGID